MTAPSPGRQRPLPPPGAVPPPLGTTLPRAWVHTRRAWRLTRHLGPREIDIVLRLRAARDLPWGYRCRLATMGLPTDAVQRTLLSVRALADWPVAWTATAQRFLGETRRPDRDAGPSPGREVALARARQRAAFCYHVAHWFAYDDPRAVRTMRSAAVALFGRAAPLLLPDLAPVRVPWRGKSLPGYLRRPADAPGPAPLVVLLNCLTTSKEELALWADAFLARGQTVLALDQPGTGEAFDLGEPSADHDDISDAVIDFASAHPHLDERRVALVGISLGGAQAVLSAALDRRIAAVVAVTPPYDPQCWLHYVNPIVGAQVAGLAGGVAHFTNLAEEFALTAVIDRLRVPLLVVGAGRDVIVPPAESVRLAAAAGPFGTLLWYGDAGHGLYDALPWWTADAAAWLAELFAPALVKPSTAASTRVDAGQTEAIPAAGVGATPEDGIAALAEEPPSSNRSTGS